MTESHKHVSGMGALSAALQGIPEDMRNKILVQGVARACKPIERAAKQNAKSSQDTGALRNSITTKTVGYAKDGKAVGLVGPARGYFTGGKKSGKLGRLLGKNVMPSKYAHLVEYGHRIAVGGSLRPVYKIERTRGGANNKMRYRKTNIISEAKGREAGFVAARPFIRPAVMNTHGEQSNGFYQGIAEGFEKSRARLVKAGVHSP